MDTRFRGVLPFKTYRVQLQGGREEILAVLDRCVTPSSMVRGNLIPFGRRLQLQGQVEGDEVHITTQSGGYNGGQVILHGHVEAEDEGVCMLRYRLIPNNFALLFVVLLLCFVVAMLKNGPVWRGLAVAAVGMSLCLLLSVVSALPLNMRLNEVLKEHLEA